jgi:hypothetical protein
MWYWFCLVASVTLVIGAVAAILLWAWRQETASRYADTLDRRFAKDRGEEKVLLPHKPKPNRDKPAPDTESVWQLLWERRVQSEALEQRVEALEERTGMLEEIENQIHSINPPLQGLSSTDSLPDTETPAEQGSTKTLSYSELFPASQGGTPKP